MPPTQIPPARQALCIYQMLKEQAEHIPAAPAILAPGRTSLSYRRLHSHVDEVVQTLRRMGIERNDRVALVLPNGPEMAVAFVAVASGATCAPLNPNYSANEFDIYFSALHVKALMTQVGMDSPAHTVAQTRGMCVIELSPDLRAEAGLFRLNAREQRRVLSHEFAEPDDMALVLHTAGTTARPKIVPLTHTNLCTSARDIQVAVELAQNDRYFNVMPLFHGAGLVLGILGSLRAGASIVCLPGFYGAKFFQWLAEFQPTWYMAVPTVQQAILARASMNRQVIARCPLRFIRANSAPLPARVHMELEGVFNVPVLESYGMTEANLIASNPLPPRQRKIGSVGIAAGPVIAIMDEAGALLPAGETGEIVMRGANVIRAYENDPMANRSAFIDGWFRSGDQGYLDSDGYLFITGRIKEIINRGGEKFAPREVDEALTAHPAVAQAVAFAVPDSRLGEDVAAAVVLHQGAALSEAELRHFAATRLAAFKVPRQILIVEDIPNGPTGKLRRIGLAERFGLTISAPTQPVRQATSTSPRTPIEEVLAGLWTQVLEVERVGIYDDFFQIGGDSLSAMQLLARVRDVTHREVSLIGFSAAPTVAAMAQSIEGASRITAGWHTLPLQPVPHDGTLPLSAGQRRLWFIEHLGLSGQAYHLVEATLLRGSLQRAALARSLQEIIRRHEILRTTFTNIAGHPFQVVGPARPLPLPVVDLRGLSESEQESQVRALARQEHRRSFDLAQGPLLRATLVCLSDEAHVLLLAMHHIVFDAWSQSVFWRELSVLYKGFITGNTSPLPAPAIQYADFAHWQQQWLQGEVLDAQLAYWQQQLMGVSALQLPTDHPRPAVQTFQGARHFLTLSSTLTRALKTLSQRYGVTLFMTLLATFQTLLQRYTGRDDIAVGSLIAHRPRVELEDSIGFFINTVVLRTDLSGDPSFRELLARVREVTLGAYEHQDVPYEKLLEGLRPARDLSRNALFQVMCVLHNTPPQVLELPELTAVPLEIDPGTTRFDVTLDFWETPQGLRGRIEYSTDLFEAATMARMAGHLQNLLEGIVADPDQRLARLPLLTDDERHRLLVEWNTTRVSYPADHCLQSVFESQVARTPDAIAVVYGNQSLTYHELNRRANQVAHYLQGLGVRPEMVVGLCVERSPAMVVALLGILKAGAAYLPLDPTYPSERLAFMLEDAQPQVVLTTERLVASLPAYGGRMVCLDTHWPTIAKHGDDNPVSAATADSVAYLLYTSGSTGRPKGVLGLHRATLNVLVWMWRTYPFAGHEVCCQKTSISFGDAIQELLGPLLQGIPIVLIADAVLQDLPRFVETLAGHRVTRLILVPSLLRTFLDSYDDLQDRLPSLKLWFAGGEALSSDLPRLFQRRLPHSCLINLYGGSEASDDTTWYDTDLAPAELPTVPIGRPIANTQVYVLDPHLQPVPIGVLGELYVGGDSLTRGYFNRPDLTAERFIPHLFSQEPGARLYRTGDVVRYRPDGNIEYVDRLDHQVKLRGIRIEPGEIEAVLAQHPAVLETVVIAHEEPRGEPRLTAYIVPTQEGHPTVRHLRRFLGKRLPPGMIPAAFVMLETLPLTPSGKVDRRALPLPSTLRPALEDLYVAPRTPIEQQIAAIWGTLLGLERVGIDDNFFELGGHSLLAMQLLSRVRDATGVEVALIDFFETPTVAGMAAAIETAEGLEQGLQAPAILPVPRTGRLPASIAQELFWVFDRLFPGLPLFNILAVVRLEGALEVAVLEQSVNEVVRRHEALRTTFAGVDEQVVQIIAPGLYIPLHVTDLCTLPETERQTEAQRVMQRESQHCFDLTQGPLLRGCLLRLGEREHLLLVALHHIVCDGWSLGVLVHDLAMLYAAFAAGRPSPLPALPIQYADFACWQRQWRYHAGLKAQLAYWREQLREPIPVLELPTDRPRAAAVHLRAARQPLQLPSALVEALKDFSQQEGGTLFMTCLTAFKMVLYGYTGTEDLCIATLVANRTPQETQGLIGLLVNTVILRTDLGGNPTCREVLQRVRATTLAAYTHQHLPFEELVRTLERERNLQRTSLCRVMIVWQSAMLQPQQRSAPTLSFQPMEQSVVLPDVALTTFDIILILRDRAQALTGTCVYKTDLFDAATIRRMLNDFQHVLTSLTLQPEQPLATFRSLSLRGARA